MTPAPIAIIGLGLMGEVYAQRLLDLPTMREWYAAGLAETFRDEPHEAEILEVGTVLEDLRST